MKIRNIGFLLNMNLIFDIITHEEYNVLARSIMVENQNAKIFVIIPVYNCERYLKECINSILNQPYKNLEAVVINDGSKDSSLAIAEEIAQVNKRVHVINQLNQGVSAARNNGIDYAIENNAKFIAFLDSDDIWTDNFCTNELINELVDQDADVVHFSFFRGNETLTKGKAVRVENKISTGKDISFWGNDSFCASIVKASLLDSNNIRFPQGIDYNEDVVFKYICLALSNKVIYKDHFSFIYRSNSSSSSHTKHPTEKYIYGSIRAWGWAKEKLAGLDITPNCIRAYRGCDSMKKTMLSEYIQVACEYGISIKEIIGTVTAQKFNYLYEDDSIWVDEHSLNRWKSFFEHPRRFWIKNRIKGIGFAFTIKIARNIKYVQKKRYLQDLTQFYSVK